MLRYSMRLLGPLQSDPLARICAIFPATREDAIAAGLRRYVSYRRPRKVDLAIRAVPVQCHRALTRGKRKRKIYTKLPYNATNSTAPHGTDST